MVDSHGLDDTAWRVLADIVEGNRRRSPAIASNFDKLLEPTLANLLARHFIRRDTERAYGGTEVFIPTTAGCTAHDGRIVKAFDEGANEEMAHPSADEPNCYFQDTEGKTPATNDGDPVGRMNASIAAGSAAVSDDAPDGRP